jgi:hypothetical protein
MVGVAPQLALKMKQTEGPGHLSEQIDRDLLERHRVDPFDEDGYVLVVGFDRLPAAQGAG